ncbi:hypothetical protein L7F22_023207 [Adiantum nelumboides]|nr:hypothetical protein [Adiantum nelumboides]
MGRNSKKNKGRKPASEQGLKGAASLATSSANIATAPARPARTAKHKVRKFPSQATTVTSSQANDSRSARGLKEIQPLLTPPNSVKHETLPSDPAATPTLESHRTCTATITEPAATISSSNEKEITVNQPDLSDSYDSLSASSSETETCMPEDTEQHSNTDSLLEIQKTERLVTMHQIQVVSVLQQPDDHPKEQEEYPHTLLVATENKEVLQIADSSGHTSGLLAVPSVASSSPSFHNQLEAKISELSLENASRAQADEEIINLQGVKEKNNSPLQPFHPDTNDRVCEVLSSLIKTEKTKQTAGDHRSSAPAVADGKEDSKQVNAESEVSEQSRSVSQASLVDALVTSSISPDNLQQIYDKVQELESVLESCDKGLEVDKDYTPAEKKYDTENFIEEIRSTKNFVAHQILLSAAAGNVEQESLEKNGLTNNKKEENRQVNLCIEKAPMCSVEHSIEEVDEDRAKEATVVEEEKEFDKEPSTTDNERKRGKNKPDLDVPKLENPTLEENQYQKGVLGHVDSGYVYREETNPAGNRQKKELETDNDALYEEESPEEMSDQLNRRADCEGHVANSVNSEKDKLEEQEPEAKVISLHKEDFLQEKHDNNHGTSVCPSVFLGQIIIQAPENGTEKLDVGEPPEGDVTFHEDQTWKDGERNQQLDGAIEGHIKSIERQMKGLEIGQLDVKGESLDKQECLQGKSGHAHFGTFSQEDETTEAVENTKSKFDVEEPLAGAVEVKGGQEEKSDQQLDGGTRCEESATNSIKRAMKQKSKTDFQKDHKEECEDEKIDQTHIGFVYKEHETEGLEKVENFNAQGDVKLNQACQEEKPDHDDSDTACQEHNRSSENEIEELEAQELGNDTEIEEEKECQEMHSATSAQEQMERSMQEVESGTLEENKDRKEKTPIHVYGGTMDEEHRTLSTENQVEKPGMGEPDSKDIPLHNKTENLENQNARGIASEENTEPSVNIEVGKFKVEALEVTVDKEGCQEEKNNDADVGSACEERKTQLLEDALKKPDLEEPQVGVMLEKNQKLEAEPSVQVDSEPECQEHPTSSMENPIKKLEVAELEKDDDNKECEEKHSTTIFLQNETEQAKLEVKTVKTEKNKESPETMPYQTDTGPVFESQKMHSVNDMLKQPDVEDVVIQKEKKIGEDLHQLNIIEGDPKTCVDIDKEKLKGGTPEVTVTKDECKEEQLCQITNLCEEHQQMDLEQMKEKPVTVESQIEGLILDKDLNLQEDELDQVHSDSRSQEHPTSYSAENENEHPKHYSTENENEQPTDYSPQDENEVRELEKAIALKGQKQHTNKSVENDMEQPKPQVESVTLEEKKESPSEKNNQIDCGRVGEEHSLENEPEKAEVGEADKEIMELHKEKDSQEAKSGQLEEGTLWKEDANESIEIETEELAVKNPKPSSTNKEELEEVKNQQDQKNALETANQEETQAGALGKEDGKEEKHQQDDTGYVCEESNTERGLCEDALETSNLEEPQVNDFILHKGEKDFQEHHTTTSVDLEVEQPEPEAVVLEEKKEGPEGKPEQIGHGCVCEEYKLRSPENKDKLEKNELGEPEVDKSAVQGKPECQEQNFKQLEKSFVSEGDAKNSTKSETEMLEARKPEVKSTKLQEECEARKDDQAEGGCVCEEHQAADFLEHAMEKCESGEPQIEGGMFGETQEPPEEKSDQVRTNAVYQEHPSNSVLRSLDIGESQTAIAGPEDEHTISSMETGIQQPNLEVRSIPIEEKEESVDQMPDQIENDNMHKDRKMPSVENELGNDKMGEPEVESVALQQNQESQEDQLEQLARDPTGEVHTENSVKNEARKSEISSNTPDKEESNEVRSTPTEENEESVDEQIPDQIEDHNMNEERKMPSVENELENDKMEEPEVESIALQHNQESQEDQLEQLARGPTGDVHTENSVKNEAKKSEINSNTLDKEESNEGKNDQTGNGSACEKQHRIQFLEHAGEKPDVEEAQCGEGAALDNEQELQEKNFDQTGNDCACKDETERAFENQKEMIEGEPDAAMALDEGKGYQEEHSCQLNMCQHSMSPDEDKKEKPAVKEQEIAPLDEAQEYQEEADDQVERDCVCSEHDTKVLDISEMEGSELKDLVVHHGNESKEVKANEVSSSSPNEEPIIDSKQKDLERLEEDKGQVGLALEEKANQGDHPSSVCGDQTPKSVARELEKVELDEPEQGVAVGDKMDCRDVTLDQNNESEEGEADKVNGSSQIEQHIPDSEKNMERTEMGEAKVDLALQEMVKCQPDYANIACEKGAQNSVVDELRLVELEEPEAETVALEKMEHQEEEPGKVHSSSTYKQQTPLMERKLEKQMEEPKVDHVNLDEHQLSQEENLSSRENCCQDTTSLLEGEGERETFVSEKPERSAAGLETIDYKNESYQLHIEPATGEHNINSPEIEVETLEMREPEGSVKLDAENESREETPAEAKIVPQGQEQTANSLKMQMEKLEVEDPEVTFEEDREPKFDKPSQLDTDSTCEEQDIGEKTNQTDQLKKEPEACGVMHAKIQGCPRDESTQIGSHSECGQHPAVSKEHRMETIEKSDQQEESAENEECQENFARLSTECVCEGSEKENLDSKNLEVDIVQLNNKKLQEKKPHKACDSSEGEQYTARSIENMEKIEVEQSMFDKAAPSIVFYEQGADFAENKIELAMPEVEPVQLEKTEDHNENPDQKMDEFVSENHLTDLVKYDMEKLQVSQTELGGHVALDEKKQFQEEITNAVGNGFACETEKPEEEDAGAAENEECHARQNHEQNDANSCVSEAQTVDSAEKEGGKHEMQVPKGETSLHKMGYQNEETDLAHSDAASEEHATNSNENTTEFEMDQPKVEKPSMNSFSRTAGEEHRVENETEKAEMKVPNIEGTTHDQAESSSIREEHAIDSKEDDMDKLELPEVGMPLEVTNRSLSTEHVADSLEHQVNGPDVEGSLLDLKESDSDRPNSDECSSVCGEPIVEIVDHYDELAVTQPKIEKNEEVIVSTSTVNEAHKLDSQKNERERSEVGVLEVEDDVLDEKESQSEKPEQDESHSVCEENASDFPDYEEGKLEMNQPSSNQVNTKSKSVYEAHMLDPHENETKKAEEELEVGNIALEPKECLSNKTHLDESSSVCEVYAADSKEEDGDEIEVNLPGEEKCDQNIAGASVLEAPKKHFSTNEMKKPDEGVPEVEDNVPEQRKCCLNREREQHESGSIHEEYATGSKSNDIDKPDVREPDECITVRSVSESDELDSLETGIEKPGLPEMKDNMQEQKECLGKTPAQDESSSVLGEHVIDTEKVDMEKPEEGVPKVKYEVLKQNECSGEKPERDDSISVLVEEHTTESKAGGRDELEVEQSKVEEPKHFRANSTAESKTHTPGTLMVETKKPQEGVLDIEDNVGHKTEQDKNSSQCEEHEVDPKEDDMDKLEINQSEVGEESHRVVVKSTSVIETYKLDFQETKTDKNEESPEAKHNVPGEKVGEKPHQAAMKSVGRKHATHSNEDETDNHSNQHEVLLEKECLDEKFDQDETTVSKEDDGDKLEVHLPELYQVITRDASSENTLISMRNETEECEVRVPEVKDDGLSEENLLPVELSDLPAEDREEKGVGQGPGKNKNANNQLHDPSSQEEEWHMEVKDSPALSKCKTEEIENGQITEISHVPGPQEGTQKHLEQLDAVRPEEAKQELHHSKSCEEDQEVHQIESYSLGQGTQMYDCREGNAAMPLKSISTTQEEDNLNLTTDDQEVEAGELRTHPDAKERFLDINELEDETRKQHTPQSVFQQESPAENENAYNTQEISATRYHSDNAALSCERDVNTTLAADQTSSNEQQSGQEKTHKDVAAQAVHEEQPNFKMKTQVTFTESDNITLNELCKELAPPDDDHKPQKMKLMPRICDDSNQMVYEARNVSEDSESNTTSKRDASMDELINAVWMPAEDTEFKTQPNNDQNSPEDINLHLQEVHTKEGQKTLAGIDDIKDDFQTVNETSAAPKMPEENFDLEETVPICIQNMNAANLEIKTDPLQENHVKQQHEEQKPKTLDVKAEDATDKELTCNLSIPILSSEEVIQQVFQSVPIPVMTCSSPSNLLPLPL